MNQPTIVVAGATGRLGGRIARALRVRGANVVALARPSSSATALEDLKKLGIAIATVDATRVDDLAKACEGASCVVSAVLGLRDVMVDAQTVLLEGAVKANVPRFIPSDYALDFTKVARGSNRNLDLHLDFQERLDKAPIQATSILCGAFMELLLGQAPFILFKPKRVLYWQNADQVLDFTTMDNVAEFTAAAALDATTPRWLKVAGQKATARQLLAIAEGVEGTKFKLTWAGNLAILGALIKFMRLVMPATNDPFPPWQGMQYSHNMFEGRAVLEPLDNARYADIKWTSIAELLSTRTR